MFAIIVGLAIGFGVPLQTSINSRLRDAFGSPFVSSFLSFLIGTIFLAIVTVATGASLGVSGAILTQQPAWLWLGGVFGVIYLTSNILLFPKLGSVQTVIFPVLGQILMGLLIDNFGWFHARVQALSAVRGIGAMLVVIGVLVTVALPGYLARRADKLGENGRLHGRPEASLWFWRLWGIFSGMLSASQTAINGDLGLVLHSAVKAALISFLIGTVLLALIVIGQHPRLNYRETVPVHRWWMWLGGFIGAFFVLGNAYLAPTIGTGLAVVIVLIGLMTGSLLVDQFGWLGAKRNPITGLQILGLLMMVGGVVLIRLI
ncbi:DMT family transporter [Secundilactobacillus kimchicus]|uniref:DMT family transporter n=1 Tax=Secundilactobacillus kimchicus TaxID=528209 RepID=UPI0024A96CB6|nr:DMT family transporter [Secundilactobacillus kimchicus]